MIANIFRKSKLRLYLALFASRCSSSSAPHIKFTTALLLCPKDPKGTNIAHIFQLSKSRPDRSVTDWRYECKATRPRTPTLVAVMLLGKPDVTWQKLDGILANVPIHAGYCLWTSAYWTWAAIDALIAQGVIDTPSGADGQRIWRRACHFAEPLALEWDNVLPTVNIDGNVVESEIRRMEKYTL